MTQGKPMRFNCGTFRKYWERSASLMLLLLSWERVYLELPKAIFVTLGESLLRIKPKWEGEKRLRDGENPGSSHT